GCLNLHASLLPRWRGAAPIQWSLFAGDAETGVSLMQMDAGLDTGPVFSSRSLPILPEDDAGSLAVRLAELSATVVREDLPLALSGALVAVPQDASRVTHAPPLTADDARLDFTRPAREVLGRIRGLAPRPGAFSLLSGRRLKILAAQISPEAPAGAPGEVVRADRGAIWIACGEGAIELVSAQPEGRRALSPLELVNGRAIRPGERLGA
ncbi:MAG: methionyl-tRNA formyltransferase, partial [Deltaproteobacteria bacterium]|nr:methionyl-tRNA formyltransferase [Deltaproteobacteria bacterium]